MSSAAVAETSVELACAYVSGTDSTAAERLYHRHRDATLQLATAGMSEKLKARVDPEDIYQSVSLILFQGLEQGKFRLSRAGDLRSLLAELTRRRILKKAELHHADKRSLHRETPSEAEPVSAASPSPDCPLELQEEIEALLARLRHPRHRMVVCLALDGLTIEQIAVACRYSGARVRQILNSVAEKTLATNNDVATDSELEVKS